MPDSPPIVANAIANVIVNEDAPQTTINLANVFNKPDHNLAAIAKTIQLNDNPNLVNAKNNYQLSITASKLIIVHCSLRLLSLVH